MCDKGMQLRSYNIRAPAMVIARMMTIVVLAKRKFYEQDLNPREEHRLAGRMMGPHTVRKLDTSGLVFAKT